MRIAIIIALSLALTACSNRVKDMENAMTFINTGDLINYVKILGHDSLQGRRPFTIGEERTVEYLKSEFERLGLKPAFNGNYFQDVPMVQVDVRPDEAMVFKTKGQKFSLTFKNDFVAVSRRLTDKISLVNSELVFVGYGIVAPEYNWNDYKNVDVKGKTVVVLVNDPGLATGDSSLFKGRSMTYYGRWTYKYEEAARQGAEGVLLVHETLGAGYPWNVVLNGALVPDLYMVPDDKYESRCKMEAWITGDAAKTLFKHAGIDSSVIKSATSVDFKAVPMNMSVSVNLYSKQEYKNSKNVMAYIEGSEKPDEVIIYSAHWDHLGTGSPVNGDSIYNGAVDNGTSLAWMFEIAKAFQALKVKPGRSIAFFAPTAEENGLIGSGYYVENPAFEINKTVANINNDLMLPYGRMKDVMVTGFGQSELEEYVERAAKLQNRYLLPDPNSHTGMYFRSDHFSFAKVGIPSLFVRGNCDHAEHGRDWMQQKELEWIRDNYHKPADEYSDDWDLSGVAEDARLLFMVGYWLGNENTFPDWKEGSEFKGIRK